MNSKFYPSKTRICVKCKRARSHTQFTTPTAKVCNRCKGK